MRFLPRTRFHPPIDSMHNPVSVATFDCAGPPGLPDFGSLGIAKVPKNPEGKAPNISIDSQLTVSSMIFLNLIFFPFVFERDDPARHGNFPPQRNNRPVHGKIFRHYPWILVKIPHFSRLDGRVAVVGPESTRLDGPGQYAEPTRKSPSCEVHPSTRRRGSCVLALSGLKSPGMQASREPLTGVTSYLI